MKFTKLLKEIFEKKNSKIKTGYNLDINILIDINVRGWLYILI